jgi:uncharacterized protein (DUF362 family)
MKKDINRREFIKKSAGVGVTAALGGIAISCTEDGAENKEFAQEKNDIAVVKGIDYLKSTTKAVEMLGGMKNFVPQNSKVAILANVQRFHPGTFTNPDVFRAAIRMCKEAGAKEINCISLLPQENWKGAGLEDVINDEGVNLKIINNRDESFFRKVAIPKGKVLKEAQIMKEFYNNDVFINIPIVKDHAGNKFTGTLKNMMGLNFSKNNRTFHKSDWTTNPDSISFLDDCIADLNTVLKPDLCILDGTEFIITKGPMGPGELRKLDTVVAGTDRVAIDAYCTRFLKLKSSDIVMINSAHKHGIGEIDLSKVKVKEVNV